MHPVVCSGKGAGAHLVWSNTRQCSGVAIALRLPRFNKMAWLRTCKSTTGGSGSGDAASHWCELNPLYGARTRRVER